MSDVMKEQKAENIRGSRKEIQQASTPARRLTSVQRRQIAGLCREIVVQFKKMDRLKRAFTSSGMVIPPKQVPRCRFSITGKGVKALRRKLRLTQAQFGKVAGISVTTVAKWERTDGKVDLRRQTLVEQLMAMNDLATASKGK